MAKQGKRVLELQKKVDPERVYQPDEALTLVKDLANAKFDETIEAHLRMGVDPRHADQMVRGSVVLPAGTGKQMRVLAFAQADKAREAEEAGADYVGSDDLIQRIQGGWLEFDVAVATPEAMGEVRKLGKVLGPRGLMPNPKTGTVTEDTARAVKEVKAGRVEFKIDKAGNIHVPVGKVSFNTTQLEENARAVIDAVNPPTGTVSHFYESDQNQFRMHPHRV